MTSHDFQHKPKLLNLTVFYDLTTPHFFTVSAVTTPLPQCILTQCFSNGNELGNEFRGCNFNF